MVSILSRLWADEQAFVVSAELVLVATIAVLGMIVGLASVRDQLVQELGDVAGSMSRAVQSYSFSGITGHTASQGGSVFSDLTDYCDSSPAAACDVDPPGEAPACISLAVGASTESN